MQSIDLIRENLRRSEERVLERIEEMREHACVFPTPRGGCHTLWVLGHLAYVESLVIRRFMLGGPSPRLARSAARDGMIEAMGAEPVRADLFEPETLGSPTAGHDAVINLTSASATGGWPTPATGGPSTQEPQASQRRSARF